MFQKTFSCLCCVLTVCILLTACITEPEEKTAAERFDEFLYQDRAFHQHTADFSSPFSMFRNGTGDGQSAEPSVTWEDQYTYPSEEELAWHRQMEEEFKLFHRSELTPEQQQSYDIVAFELGLYQQSLDLWYFKEPLKCSNGLHTQLLIALREYALPDEEAVQYYFAYVKAAADLIDQIAAFETIKSQKGMFMSDQAADQVIEACESLTEDVENHFLVTEFPARIAQSNITDPGKLAYYALQNVQILEEYVVAAYRRLIDTIRSLKGTGQSGGLSHCDRGQEYCEYQLKAMGASGSAQDYIQQCETIIAEFNTYVENVYREDSTLFDTYMLKYSPDLTPEETVAFWKEQTAADFPELGNDITYSIQEINEDMSSHFSVALYIVPSLENYQQNTIYINPEYWQEDTDLPFATLAHEGYPGHMLQRVLVFSSNLSDYRKELYYHAYTEGWATYAELYSYRYIEMDRAVRELKVRHQEYEHALNFRIDLGIHYEGWEEQDLANYIAEHFPWCTQETIAYYQSNYQFYANHPLYYAPYTAGYLDIKAIKEWYQQQTGDSYSDKAFHEAILKNAEAPFSFIQQWMNEELPENDSVYRTDSFASSAA